MHDAYFWYLILGGKDRCSVVGKSYLPGFGGGGSTLVLIGIELTSNEVLGPPPVRIPPGKEDLFVVVKELLCVPTPLTLKLEGP